MVALAGGMESEGLTLGSVTASGAVLSDLGDPAPKITHHRAGRNEIVTVECALVDVRGQRDDVVWLQLVFLHECEQRIGGRVERVLPGVGAAVREVGHAGHPENERADMLENRGIPGEHARSAV